MNFLFFLAYQTIFANKNTFVISPNSEGFHENILDDERIVGQLRFNATYKSNSEPNTSTSIQDAKNTSVLILYTSSDKNQVVLNPDESELEILLYM